MSRIPILLFFFLLTPTLASATGETATVHLPDETFLEWRTSRIDLQGTLAPQVEAVPVAPATVPGETKGEGAHIHRPALGWNELHVTGVPKGTNLSVNAEHVTSGDRALVRGMRHVGPSEARADLLLTHPGEWRVHVTVADRERTLRVEAPAAWNRAIPLQGDTRALLTWTQAPDHTGLAPVAFELYAIPKGGTPAPVGAEATVHLSTGIASRSAHDTPGPQQWHPVEWDTDAGVHRATLALDRGLWDLTVAADLPNGSAGAIENLWVDGHAPIAPETPEPTARGHQVALTFTRPGPWALLVHDPLTGLHDERLVHVEAARPRASIVERQTTALGEGFWGRAAAEGGFRTPHHRIEYRLTLHDATGLAAPGVPDAHLELPDLGLELPLTEVPPATYLVTADLPEGLHAARFLAPSLGLDAANATWFAVEAGPTPQDVAGAWGPLVADPNVHAERTAEAQSLLREHAAFSFAIAGGMTAGLLLVLRRR